jgi:glycine/D-amino acid oxidase-like deaminating enzyme
MDCTHVVIGGGTYGCFAALTLAGLFHDARILVVEEEDDLMRRASYNNQARVHNGYHYPRSVLTALRSRVNAPRFAAEFGAAIVADFEQYYAISRQRSNVTAAQFEQFCRRIGAELKPAPQHVRRLFDEEFVEDVYRVREYAFDAAKLREILRHRLEERGIEVLTRRAALRIVPEPGARFRVELRNLRSGEAEELHCAHVYNCTYSRLNEILARSGLETVRLKHEATEIALVELPPALEGIGITVMCGPFFSVMPFPPEGLSSFSHVSYTPHYEWIDDPARSADAAAPHRPAFPLPSWFDRMRRDAARYVPALRDCRYRRSLWEVKTVLPESGANDSRPILFKRDTAAPNVISLLGGKIDNIFDLADVLPGPGERARGRAAPDEAREAP